ncbi:hypothetical protein TD95_002921, partial [Thielaviopsis punctulata]
LTTKAVGQITSTASMAANLAQCRVAIQKAAAAGAAALFLPEASDYIASSATESMSLVRSVEESEFVTGLQEEARRFKIPIHVGVHEPGAAGKVKNTVIWIDEKGDITQRYQKLHLFDVEIEGSPIIRESDSVERGTEMPTAFDTPVGRVGPAICFDLRFPEIGLAHRRQGADIITYPSAFTIPTGQAHWEVLLRARAIETQTYVIAAAQAGQHNQKRRSYGHSMIVDPWGRIVAQLKEESPEIATAEISFDLLKSIQAKIPLVRQM